MDDNDAATLIEGNKLLSAKDSSLSLKPKSPHWHTKFKNVYDAHFEKGEAPLFAVV